jgi:hypothetical protein
MKSNQYWINVKDTLEKADLKKINEKNLLFLYKTIGNSKAPLDVKYLCKKIFIKHILNLCGKNAPQKINDTYIKTCLDYELIKNNVLNIQ